MVKVTKFFVLICLALSTLYVHAMDRPKEKVLLTIFGNISESNSSQGVQLDASMLLAFEQAVVETSHPWTDKSLIYTGPKLADLLAFAGAKSQRIKLMALNKYVVDIDADTVAHLDIIVAIKENNKRMNVMNNGPLWIMCEYENEDCLEDMLLWQLVSIEVI